MDISNNSAADKTVDAFLRHNFNYMRIAYATEIKIRETIKDAIRYQPSEEDFWERMTDICPQFCDFMSR